MIIATVVLWGFVGPGITPHVAAPIRPSRPSVEQKRDDRPGRFGEPQPYHYFGPTQAEKQRRYFWEDPKTLEEVMKAR